MKHLIFIAALALFVMLEFITQSVFAFNSKEVPVREVPVAATIEFRPKVTISFIIARRRDCEGFGICQISFDITTGKINGGNGTLYADKNNMILEIDKGTGINDECYNRYFASGKFLMEDESPVPGDVLRELSISGSRILQAGNHKVTERNGKLYVVIPVR